MGNTITRRELFGIGRPAAISTNIIDSVRTYSGLTPYAGSWTEIEILHLLRRATFGATVADVNLIKTKSITEAIDLLIDNPELPTTKPVNNYSKDFNIPNQTVDTQGCLLGNNWVDHIPPTNWESDNDLGSLEFYRCVYSFIPWWFGELIGQKMHVLEKINLFWANHFSTIEEDSQQGKAVWRYYSTLRSNAIGNFRTLIKQVTVDPHMLFFLNGHYNTANAPDENYGRELQELFTVGKGPDSGYTEADVQAAAKVLTGWRRKTELNGTYTSSFDSTKHSTGNKQFSSFYGNRVINGKTGAAGATETDDLIDMILQTQECALYICRRLYKWFVYYKIDATTEANVIVPLAEIFRNSNYEITPVLKALFRSEHFFDSVNYGCMIKSPVDMYVGMLREFKVVLADTPIDRKYRHWRYFKDRCDASNQRIADPPNVSGWTAYYQEPIYYRAWITSDTINKRLKALNDLSKPGVTIDTVKIKINSIAFNLLFPSASDPNAVVRSFINYLLPQDLSQTQKDYMKSILLSNQSADFYWSNAWNAYIGNPADTMAENIVRTRLDTLINYITSLEEYQLC
ncbi:MAG: DUF1800 family protein [Chitinophagaceae bacterium]